MKPPSADLVRLVERVQHGDRDAMEELASALRPQIERQLLRYPITEEDRRDLLQVTLLRVLRQIGSFRGEASFSTWLFRVTANEAYMLMRKQRRHSARLTQGLDLEELSSLSAANGGSAEDGDDALAARERSAWVEHALAELPDGDRELVLAHYHLELELQQIADRYALTEPAVRSRLHRARRRLRALLEETPPHAELAATGTRWAATR